MFVMSFLSWATSGESFSLVGMMQDTVSRSVPITLGALGGILCERSGVINIAIEGMLLAGAFTGAVGASLTNLWLGTIIAMLTGVLLAWLLAVFSIKYRVDQVIVGFAINFFVLGITFYCFNQIGNQVGPALVLVFYFRPFGSNCLLFLNH